MLTLKAVSTRPMDYGILLRIHQILKEECLEIHQGSLYPALYRSTPGLDHYEWGESENKRKAKVLPSHKHRQA